MQQKQESTASVDVSSRLPAKKRKESRDLPEVTDSRTFCLPTKKRVWALNPDWMTGNPLSSLDLNVEYKEGAEDEKRRTAPAKIPKEGPVGDGDDKENRVPCLSIGDRNLEDISIGKDSGSDLGTEIGSVEGKDELIDAEEEGDDSLSIGEGDLEEIPIAKESGADLETEIRSVMEQDESIEPAEEGDDSLSIGEGDLEDIPTVKESGADLETEIRSVKGGDESIEAEEEEDDGILCAICQSTDGDPSDPIVFCDGCDLMVHATCYGNPLVNGIPEGDWFCAQCLASKSSPSTKKEKISCCLCPNLEGAMKPTDNNQWAHVLCALYVPEVFFKDPVGKEGIDFSKVPKRRWEEKCYICKRRSGCVLECSEPKCPLWFHVTCGLNQDLAIEYKEGKRGAVVAGFCESHTELWKKQQQTGKFKIVARD